MKKMSFTVESLDHIMHLTPQDNGASKRGLNQTCNSDIMLLRKAKENQL